MNDQPFRVQQIDSRSYAGEEDYGHMRRLLIDVLGRAGLPVYATIGDIDWWRATDTDLPLEIIRLWFDGDRLVAFAWPVEDQVDCVVHPDYPAIHDETAAWSEEEYRQRLGERPEKPLRVWSYTSDTARAAALAARGYRRTDDYMVFFAQPAVAADPTPLPAGYTFDHVRGEADVARRVAVHRDAFAPSQMTADKIHTVMAMPTYRPELELVIVAPDESYAAFTLAWLDEANHVGAYEPVGVAAEHRRRGLGHAILREGVRRLAQHGAETVCVQTSADNIFARAMYKKAGFVELDRNYAWTRSTD